MESNLAVLFLD